MKRTIIERIRMEVPRTEVRKLIDKYLGKGYNIVSVNPKYLGEMKYSATRNNLIVEKILKEENL